MENEEEVLEEPKGEQGGQVVREEEDEGGKAVDSRTSRFFSSIYALSKKHICSPVLLKVDLFFSAVSLSLCDPARPCPSPSSSSHVGLLPITQQDEDLVAHELEIEFKKVVEEPIVAHEMEVVEEQAGES